MRTTQQMSITLPLDMAEAVRFRVKSGRYASESEVIREGLRALSEREDALEQWLRKTVVPRVKAARSKGSQTKTAAQVRSALKRARVQRG